MQNQTMHGQLSKIHDPQQPAKPGARGPLSQEEVQRRAYQIYVSRNRQPGHELDDWLQAERELLTVN
jgi:Protein of unknown function (DUF2934)